MGQSWRESLHPSWKTLPAHRKWRVSALHLRAAETGDWRIAEHMHNAFQYAFHVGDLI